MFSALFESCLILGPPGLLKLSYCHNHYSRLRLLASLLFKLKCRWLWAQVWNHLQAKLSISHSCHFLFLFLYLLLFRLVCRVVSLIVTSSRTCVIILLCPPPRCPPHTFLPQSFSLLLPVSAPFWYCETHTP